MNIKQSTNYGYVYALTGGGLEPGIYKIGATTNHPLERARQLSASSGVISPFVVAYYRQLRNPFGVEAEIHRQLDLYRINDSREFFKLPLHKIITLLEQYDEVNGIFYGDDIETPFANLFASFEARNPGDQYEHILSPEEQRACRRLETEIVK